MRQQVSTNGGQNYVSHQNVSDDQDQQYESVFTDMAYQAFNLRFPEFAPHVINFQVIESDIEKGSAVGSFVMDANGEPFHVPVVMVDNKIKPMEILYSKRLDKFFPFNEEWLNVVSSTGDDALGEGVSRKDLSYQTTRDPSTLLQAPNTNFMGGRLLSPIGVKEASDKTMPNFSEFLKVAEDKVKDGFLQLLKDNEALFKFAAAEFDMDKLREGLQKTARLPDDPEGAIETDILDVVDADTPVDDVKNAFRTGPSTAMESIAMNGFAVNDKRKDLNIAYSLEHDIKLEELMQSGYYKLYNFNGESVPALVIFEPFEGRHSHGGYEICCGSMYGHHNKRTVDKLVILGDGSYFATRKNMVGTPCVAEDVGGEFTDKLNSSKPKKGDAVTFIKNAKGVFRCIKPMYVGDVVMEKSGVIRYYEEDPYKDDEYDKNHRWSSEIGRKNRRSMPQIVVMSVTPKGEPYCSKGTSATFVDKYYKPFVLSKEADATDFLTEPVEILHFLKMRALEEGSKELKVASRGAGEFSINGKLAGDARYTSEKIAREHHVDMMSVFNKLKSIGGPGEASHVLVVPFEKNASIFAGTPGAQMSPDMVQQNAMNQAQPGMEQAAMAQPGMEQAGMGNPAQIGLEQPQMDPNAMQPGMDPYQMDPSLMQAGMDMQNPEIYNLGAIKSIAQDPHVKEMLLEYTPNLEKAMDSAGRLLLTLWVEGSMHLEELGEDKFRELESSARNTFKEIGNLLLLLSKRPESMPMAM